MKLGVGAVPVLLIRTGYVATLPSRVVERYLHELDAFELPFYARGFTMFAT